MLTSFADDEALFASIMAGASGYVLKQIHSPELLAAIRAVGPARGLLDPAVTNRVLDRAPASSSWWPMRSSSAVTRGVIGDLAETASNDPWPVGSVKTVKNYVSSILAKLRWPAGPRRGYLPATPSPAAPDRDGVGRGRRPPHHLRTRRHRPPLVLLHGYVATARHSGRRSKPSATSSRSSPGTPPGRPSSDPRSRSASPATPTLAGFIQELGLASPHVAGLSFGGILALALYGRRPAIPAA